MRPSSLQNLPAQAAADFAPGIEAAFPREFQESDEIIESVEGHIPGSVRGTYYLNGPARFGINDFSYNHWLDGDGMICALHFGADGVRFTNRYVRSAKFVAEREADRPLFRAFGTTFPDSRMNRLNNGLESPVNVSVYLFGDRLLAFGEQGLPWELDPITLETRGQFTFDGRLNDASPFAAHPKFDLESGEMFNFGSFFSVQTPRLYFYCFDREGLRYRKAIPLEHPHSVHDFSLSKQHATFYLSPYFLDINALLREAGTVMESLQWWPEHESRLLILARSTGETVASIPIGNRYCLHLVNSFERDGKLVVDVLEFDEPIYRQYQPIPDLFQDVPKGGPVRFVIDLRTGELVERTAMEYLFAPDFPAVDPHRVMHPYDDFWMLGISACGNPGRKFFDQLVHANWKGGPPTDVYTSPTMRYLGGEPVFVGAGSPTPSESVVVCQEFDARAGRSFFLLFDAHNVSKGPVARIALGTNVPLGFHATFKPEAESA